MPSKLNLPRIDVFLAVYVILAAILIFTNLGSVYLWEDEAETALVAKTIWTNGIPKITDGTNFFYQEQGSKVGFGDIWAWTPWLQFYLAAVSLKLLGWSAWAARLPFALFGLLSVVLFYRTVQNVFTSQTARLATFLLLACVPFLLYVRQCRYYALVIFVTLWAINALVRIEQNKKFGFLSLFGALFFLFHANYIALFSLLFSIFAYAFFPGFGWAEKKRLILTGAFALLANSPWFLLFKPLHEKVREFDLGLLFESVFFSLESLNHYVVPFVLLLFIPVILRFLPKRDREPENLELRQTRWLCFFVLFILFSIGFAYLGPARVFRYLVGIIPIAILLLALLLERLIRRNAFVGWPVVLVLVFSNIFHVAPYPLLANANQVFKHRLKWKIDTPVISYGKELIHPPHGPIRAITSFLKDNASPDDLVLVTYGDLPIIFYTGLRVIGGLSFRALERAKEADWIIPRKVLISDEDARVMVYLLDTIPWERYEPIKLRQTDFPWEYIPEPNAHQFHSLEFNSDWAVEIYKKLDPGEKAKAPGKPGLFYFTPMHKSISGDRLFREEVIRYLLWLKQRTGKS